ncbi:TPA: outer membrane lipoprotein-sorting protein [Candidatus Poribacteria bacterium]|nr:outer membrane lipoprotein-sorting protein [Candidatus Poribacteria bacterium]
MVAKISGKVVRVLVVTLLASIFGVSQGITADWATVLKEAKAKYAKFEKEVKDMDIVQEIKLITSEGPMTSETKMLRKGQKFRMDTQIGMQLPQIPKEMGSMEIIIIDDGKDTWMISSLMGKMKLSNEQRDIYQKERNWWRIISDKAKIVGTDKIGNRECYVVLIKEQNKSPFNRIWLDKKNLVLVQAETKESEAETMLVVSSDFRKIKGDWEWPYKTEIYTNGKLMATSRIKSLEINKGLSDDLFKPDKVEVKELDLDGMMKKMMEKGGFK